MARLLGPDSGARLALRFTAGRQVEGLAGKTLTVYTDEACTQLASIAAYNPAQPTTPGATITGSQVKVDPHSMVPLFWYPTGVDTLWAITRDGYKLRLTADLDSRVDTAVQKGELVVNVKDFGAAGDGTIADVAIQAAVTAAATSGGLLHFPAGNYRVTASINLPDGVIATGVGGKTIISVAAGFNFPVFLIDGVRASVRDLVVQKASGAAAGANGNAIRIVGNSDGALVSNVTADGMLSPFYVAGQLGTTPGTAKRVAFNRCRALNSAQFGFEIDECDGVELVHCTSNVSGLDGVKLRRKTKNVVVTGGFFTGATGGDGMDCFAGGDTFTIQGTVFADNLLNGLVIKNDDLNRTDPAGYGYVRAANVIGVLATGNGGSGIACHRSSGNPDDPTEPLNVGINIMGCQINNNGTYGLYLNARMVTVSGVTSRRNKLDGVYLEPACRDIDLMGVHVAGNSVGLSYAPTGTRDGFHINGSRIRISGGSSLGSDPDGATGDADIIAATATQRYGLRVEAAATEVDVWGLQTLHNLTGEVSDLSAGGIRTPGPSTAVNYLDAGKYVVPGGTRSTLQLLASVENAVPIWIGNGATVVRIGVEVTVAGTAGTTIRLGIRSTANHGPGAVLGEATVAGDAVTSGVEATVSIAVPSAGLYWLTATAQNTGAQLPTIRATSANLAPVWSGSLVNALSASPLAGYQTAATVTGALPATYTVSNRVAAAPLIAIRA